MTIRARVLLGFSLLTLLMFAQVVLVWYLHRETLRLRQDAVATRTVLNHLDDISRDVLQMVAAARGYAIGGDRAMAKAVAVAASSYETNRLALLANLDPAHREDFEEVDRLVRDWRTHGGEALIRAHDRGQNTADILMSEAEPRAALILPAFDQLKRRETTMLDARQAGINQHLVRASWTMTVIPALCAFLLFLALLDALLHMVRPLNVLRTSARQVARGDFSASLPLSRGDELGALSESFMDMSAAVQRRERDLSEALGRERESTEAATRLRAEVERQHEWLLATLETVPVALVILDANARVSLQNKAAEAMLGQPPHDPEEQTQYWKQFFVRNRDGQPISPSQWAPLRALAGETVISQELSVRTPAGHTIPIVVGAAPLRDAEGRIAGCISAFQDVTPLMEVEQMKSDFVAIVSHELRTPLTSIRGGLQLVLDDDAVTDPEHLQLLTVSLNNAERLIRIVNDILDMSKIEAGRLPLDKRPCRVDELWRIARQSVERLAADAGVRLDARIGRDVRPVLVDLDRIVQALVNLVSNAVKFAPAGTEVTISAENRPDDGFVSIAVQDRGAGISAENVSKLFEKFQQVDSSPSRRVGGTGLGLAITKALVEQHGGHISVVSEPGQGSTFTLLLPAADTPYGTRGRDIVSAAGASPNDALSLRPRVLLAEDDEGLLFVLTQALTRGGLDVEMTRNGHDAWHVVSGTAPDLVVLDLAMPQMDGFEVIRRIRATARLHEIPIVAISGSDRAGPSEQRARELGANCFLAKPLDANGLVREVQRLLAASPTTLY